MFFVETMQVFFDKDSRKDLLGLIVGLIGVFTFANVMMPDEPSIFISAAMIFTSALYRFVMVNDDFVKNDRKKLTTNNVIDFVISKNTFVTIFSTMLLIVVIICSSVVDASFLSFTFLREILTYNFFVLGSDNIIYIFHNIPVKGYASGLKRNEQDDIQVGLENFKDQIPSFVVTLFFIILFFVIEFNPNLYLSIYYYVICIITLIYFKKLLLEKKE